MRDAELRSAIYGSFASRGAAPTLDEIAGWMGGADAAAGALARLHEAHAIVLDHDGSIRMALPFSNVATPFRVRHGDRTWIANCAWDALAIPAALSHDAHIEAPWCDAPGEVDLAIVDGELSHTEGHVHFAIPAHRWWDDIVET